MFYQLPPVGNPIRQRGIVEPESVLQTVFSPYQARFFASGTAALAAAIIAAINKKPVDHPEVILPAYGCPDLISAVVFAGAQPVLVDLEGDRPWMDLNQVAARIGSRTVAVVATDLFGISERMERLRPLAEHAGAVLIEDSAQAFPGGEEDAIWKGDLVVLSFGRGKPVGLLGGGAVLFREGAALHDRLPAGIAKPGSNNGRRTMFRLETLLYNRMTSPWLYWMLQGLPFLHLGETRYQPLSGIDGMDAARLALLPANITAYRNDDRRVQKAVSRMLGEMEHDAAGIIDLPEVCRVPPVRPLLRYPLLVNAAVRDRIYRALQRRGLGSSRMYPTALTGIPGLEALLMGQGPFPAAEAFAARIVTLPTHQRVDRRDIEGMRQVLEACQGWTV